MFFILSKTLDFLIMPLSWVIILMLLTLFVKKTSLKKRFLIAAISFCFVFGNSFIVDEAIRLWEVPAINLNKNEQFDFGIVLSGMTVWDAHFKRINFNGNVDRLLQTLPLHKNGQIKNLLISGGDGSLTQSQEKEALLLKNYLTEIAYPTTHLYLESNSKNTFENAKFSAQFLTDSLKIDLKKSNILLITSSMHMRRSISIFKKQGFNCKAFVTNRISGPRKYEFDHLFLPKTEAFNAWKTLLHEVIGYITYYLMGYL